MEPLNQDVTVDQNACAAADAVMMTGSALTSAERTRAAIRAYLMAQGRTEFAPFQLAAEAIALETGR